MTAPASSLGPNVPQAPALSQATDQVTAALPPTVPLGYVAAAVRVAAAFTANDVGGGEMNTTALGFAGGVVGADGLPDPPQPDTRAITQQTRIQCRIAFIRAYVASVRDQCALQQPNATASFPGTRLWQRFVRTL